jgi:hypothetical protein
VDTSALSVHDPEVLCRVEGWKIIFFFEMQNEKASGRKATRKIIVLCVLIFTFLEGKREDKRF